MLGAIDSTTRQRQILLVAWFLVIDSLVSKEPLNNYSEVPNDPVSGGASGIIAFWKTGRCSTLLNVFSETVLVVVIATMLTPGRTFTSGIDLGGTLLCKCTAYFP